MSISPIVKAMPEWATLCVVHADGFDFKAQIARAGGAKSVVYDLHAYSADGTIVVGEKESGTLLPAWCPQRHINRDGSFCLALRKLKDIAGPDGASLWWERLRLFLLCQEVARNTRMWPPHAQISHGEAGEFEYQAEKISTNLGLQSDYNECVRHDHGKIYEMLRFYLLHEKRLRNGRAECFCGYKDARKRPLLRRKCKMLSKECVVALEVIRRNAEKEFWIENSDSKCCGTMGDCPLLN